MKIPKDIYIYIKRIRHLYTNIISIKKRAFHEGKQKKRSFYADIGNHCYYLGQKSDMHIRMKTYLSSYR